ncbi:MAG: hypothetical protein HOH74_11665, partial [Gemmatimonadetes bacterium]|nr:hypothetical protein [Gemmatimonadota bacterium]
MQVPVQEPLAPRLFGYATLFRAHQDATGVSPIHAEAPEEALALAGALARHLGLEIPFSEKGAEVSATLSESGEWGVSVPFGRCGIDGRPEEHVRIFGASEAWCDRLGMDGSASSVQVEEGQTLTFLPGSVQRLRARPRNGGRVLVAFQTEDRTPLLGHAAAWAGEGVAVPEEAGERVLLTHRAFDELAQAGGAAIRERLGAFMTAMENRLSDDAQVAEAH